MGSTNRRYCQFGRAKRAWKATGRSPGRHLSPPVSQSHLSGWLFFIRPPLVLVICCASDSLRWNPEKLSCPWHPAADFSSQRHPLESSAFFSPTICSAIVSPYLLQACAINGHAIFVLSFIDKQRKQLLNLHLVHRPVSYTQSLTGQQWQGCVIIALESPISECCVELSLLIELLHPSCALSASFAAVEINRTTFDRERFLKMVKWHRVTPQVYQALVKVKDELPDSFFGQLEWMNRRSRLAHLTMSSWLAKTSQSLKAQGIEFISLKGIGLSKQLYGESGYRQSGQSH